MKSRNIATRGTVMLALVGCLVGPGALQAQTMDQYYAVPPFVSDQVAPNIVLLLDNSGSMSGLACDLSNPADGDCSDAGDRPFTNTFRFSGYFDPLLCYTYDNGADKRFEPATVKAALATACPNTEWDGNFLNFATFRRFDALKKSMIGGDCFVARAADGTCPTNGTPGAEDGAGTSDRSEYRARGCSSCRQDQHHTLEEFRKLTDSGTSGATPATSLDRCRRRLFLCR